MSKCFLRGYGACRGKASREHFISANVLRQLSLGKTVTIGGLPWQAPSTLQNIGLGSLQAKILCEGHNNGLTLLDSTAGELLRTLDAIDKAPSSVAGCVRFDGPVVERWFLKVICGLVAGQRISGGIVPDEWKSLLTGSSWPDGWGLYCFNHGSPQILSKDVHIEPRVDPETRRILAVPTAESASFCCSESPTFNELSVCIGLAVSYSSCRVPNVVWSFCGRLSPTTRSSTPGLVPLQMLHRTSEIGSAERPE